MPNFIRLTDCTGQNPIDVRIGVPQPPRTLNTHRWWVAYRGNRPVQCRPYPGQKTVLNIADNKLIPIDSVPQV